MRGRWVDAGFSLKSDDATLYVARMREPGHAVAGSRLYRTWLTGDMVHAGQLANTSVYIPMRFLHGMGDTATTPRLLHGYCEYAADYQLETVDGDGHGMVDQRPDLVIGRLREFLHVT